MWILSLMFYTNAGIFFKFAKSGNFPYYADKMKQRTYFPSGIILCCYGLYNPTAQKKMPFIMAGLFEVIQCFALE